MSNAKAGPEPLNVQLMRIPVGLYKVNTEDANAEATAQSTSGRLLEADGELADTQTSMTPDVVTNTGEIPEGVVLTEFHLFVKLPPEMRNKI
jgi:hypothetical protein